MDAHFLEYHTTLRHNELQREMRAIRLGELARGQRTGRLMRVLRVIFASRPRLSAPAQPKLNSRRAPAKLAR